MKKLSVVISAYNEEKKIKECLESVSFADEIIVVNNESTDKTEEIAKQFTSKVFTQKNDPLKIDLQKNFGFSKATGDWILSIDADERVTPELRSEIQSVLEIDDPRFSGYWIPRKNIIFGKWIESDMWWPDYQLRLFRKGKGKYTGEKVHEYLIVDGETEKLKNPLLHLNYETVSQYLHKMITIYSENESEYFLKSGRRVRWADALRYPVNDFLKTFFAQKGYKDGMHGLVLSMFQAFYAEVVFAKMWEKQGFPEYNNNDFVEEVRREFNTIKKDTKYWLLTALMETHPSKLKKNMYRVFRKGVNRK